MGQPVPVGPLPWSVQSTIPFSFTTSDGYAVSGTVAANDTGLPTVPLTWDSSTSSYVISHDFLASSPSPPRRSRPSRTRGALGYRPIPPQVFVGYSKPCAYWLPIQPEQRGRRQGRSAS